MQFYLFSTEFTIQESFLGRTGSTDHTGLSEYRRLQNLEAILLAVERWVAVFSEMPAADWVGFTVDTFAQFTHCLVVLFKLTKLEDPGWDVGEVRRRADVFNIMDRACEMIDHVPTALGIVDTDGPRKGLFSKTGYLLRATRALFSMEMGPKALSGGLQSPPTTDNSGDCSSEFPSEGSIPDDFILGLADEPWLSDILWVSEDL